MPVIIQICPCLSGCARVFIYMFVCCCTYNAFSVIAARVTADKTHTYAALGDFLETVHDLKTRQDQVWWNCAYSEMPLDHIIRMHGHRFLTVRSAPAKALLLGTNCYVQRLTSLNHWQPRQGVCFPTRQRDHGSPRGVGWGWSAADEASDQFIWTWRVQWGDMEAPLGEHHGRAWLWQEPELSDNTAPSERIRWDQRDGEYFGFPCFLGGLWHSSHTECYLIIYDPSREE